MGIVLLQSFRVLLFKHLMKIFFLIIALMYKSFLALCFFILNV